MNSKHNLVGYDTHVYLGTCLKIYYH